MCMVMNCFSVCLQERPLAVAYESTPDAMESPGILPWGEIAGRIADVFDVLAAAVLSLHY